MIYDRDAVFDLRDYGLGRPDVADDDAIDAAIAKATSLGGTIWFPTPYHYQIKRQHVIKSVYPVNLYSDMYGFPDQNVYNSYISPAANLGATSMFRYEAPAGGHNFKQGAGSIRGLAFYDPTNAATYVGNFSMLAALDLFDFNLGTVENCFFHVLNGGAMRAVQMVMGNIRGCVVRYCGAGAQAAISLEPTGGSNVQSVTVSECKIEANYGTSYLLLNSTCSEVKIEQCGFESNPSLIGTGQTFIDNSGQHTSISDCHMNRTVAPQLVFQAASNFGSVTNLHILPDANQTGSNITINGANHNLSNINVHNGTGATAAALAITGAWINVVGYNSTSSGGISISGNSYVNIKNAIINSMVAGSGAAAIDNTSQFVQISGCIITSLPANTHGIRMSGTNRASSVIDCVVRDATGTGVGYVDNGVSGFTRWIANASYSNAADWSATAAAYTADANYWALAGPGGTQKSQVVAAAATLNIDPKAGSKVRINLSATAITALTLVAGIDGQTMTVAVAQDATGGRAIPTTWSNVKFAGGTYTATATLNKIDTINFVYDATAVAWLETSRALNE